MVKVTTSFKERLLEALRDSGKKPAEIYRACGSNKGTWGTWVGVRESVPEPEMCAKLARALGVNLVWLVDGKGEKKASKMEFSQEQMDIAEAWPTLSPDLQKHIAWLMQREVAERIPALRESLAPVDPELQERANRLLEAAQKAARKKT